MATPDDDVQQLVKQLMAGASPEESMALLDALMGRRTAGILEALQADEEPTLGPPPTEVHGYRVRLDLQGAKPPVWRRLELPGDLTLAQLHDVIQAAMGWWPSRRAPAGPAGSPALPRAATTPSTRHRSAG
jgi:hypothetical protein